MDRSVSIPPLPPGWPYAPRTAQGGEERTAEGSVPGAGLGWTLTLRRPLPFEAGAEAAPLSFGRGGVRRIGPVVVRPYRRGGFVRHLNERIYASPARFAGELRAHAALWDAGFPTVEPLGFAWRRRLWGVEGLYLSRFVEAVPWPARWERSGDIVPALAVQLRALAAWGLLAPDLNATNVLVTPGGEVLTLDWDRARWVGEGDLLDRYRQRLERSLRKLGAPEDVLRALATSLGA